MKNKTIVILRGLGGNFKSSIAKKLCEAGYVMIPEGNREFEKILCKQFERSSDTELNYCAKALVFKCFLDNQFPKYVSDRGLIDSALMNEFVKSILTHYKGAESSKMDLESIYREECALLNGYNVINILLRTNDKEFLKRIIDDSFDIRANFFDCSENYLECQEMYSNFILTHYNQVRVIDIDEVPHCKKYSAEMNDFVDKLCARVMENL